MGFIAGAERTQATLFPQSLDEYVTPENPVRFIEAFVAGLDLAELSFVRAEPAATGRPGYDPGDLLRLYVYGYLNRVRSSRRLEQEAGRNLELMWLLRKLKPDFKTIADFRALNSKALTAVCQQFVLLCRQLGLYGGELVAVDGSKFRASNSRERVFTAAKLKRRAERIEEQIRGYLAELDRNDQQEEPPARELTAQELRDKIARLQERQQRYQGLRDQLQAQDREQVALTDPDARLMPQSHSQGGGTVVAYNVQTAVDAKHHLIATHLVTTDGTDQRQLAAVALKAKAALGAERLTVVADQGYYDGDEVAACEAAGVEVLMNKPATSRNLARGLFAKSAFRYDPDHDRYRCPAGEWLSYRFSATAQGRRLKYYFTAACAGCQLRPRCTTQQQGPRRITRLVNEAALERMAERVARQAHQLRRRKALVEHPFGTLKRGWDHGYFLLRSLPKVASEVSLSVLSYNLRRALNILGPHQLLAAMA